MSYLARLKAKIGEKPLPGKLTELTKGASVSFVSPQGGAFCRNAPGNDDLAESVRDAIRERAALCAGVVPAIYVDAWARLNHQKPMRVAEAEWRRSLDDGARFLGRWGSEAALWGWIAGDLFDVPRDGQLGGLIWFIGGEQVEAFGPEHARTASGRVFDRLAKGGKV